MAIWMMCEPSTPGAVKDTHWSTAERDIYRAETHKGLVLGLREANGYDDSDFYAVVWNEEKGDVEEIMYASTRGWTYPNCAVVDATEEVLAKFDALIAKRTEERRALAAAREAAKPKRGSKVKIARKVKGKHACEKGETGEVFWTGKDRYAAREGALRVGVALESGRKVFVAGNAVEVVPE